ncbi:PREDICTED: uncharacterized protein LOC109181269 [Ipomoea nil]|uniref:uncharacterized protein LOC109181269 n=1 Tax=Ipomoea nil TaxID=35883 RepID=UPI000900A899|nr:PREDICTED: uncharacterized protein LOC109181269 [Ipomoea nil]
MATAWPTIGNHPVPANNTTSLPAPGGNPMNTGAAQPPARAATSLNSTEVSFNPQNQSNPYYLHINENPALELVPFPMDGSNYHTWARAMTMALSCKNKTAFINGAIRKPPEDDLERYMAWERCNNIVASWIIRSLSPTIGRSVLWIDTAHGIWNDLKRRFSKQDLFRIAEIKCEIYQIKQGDNSLNEYFTKQKLMWDELSILRPMVYCDCAVKCNCGKKIDDLNEQLEMDKLSIFLIGLHERYTWARNQIMLLRPLPEVNEAY